MKLLSQLLLAFLLHQSLSLLDNRTLTQAELTRSLGNQRSLSAPEYLYMLRVLPIVHLATADEKKGLMDDLNSTVQNAQTQNNKIGNLITKCQETINQVKDISQKLSNPTQLIKDQLKWPFRRLQDSQGIIQ